MPKVLNVRTDNPTEGSVYVGRPSKWGNPYREGFDGTRREVIEKFRSYISLNYELLNAVMNELRGKDLICWCAPKPCHADVLLEIANADN